MGGDKETLFFFFSTIFLIKLDQSETELRPWLSYLSLSKFITKLGYPKVLPLIRDPNFLDPASILFDSAIRNILASRDPSLEIDLPSSYAGQRNYWQAEVSSPLAELAASCS